MKKLLMLFLAVITASMVRDLNAGRKKTKPTASQSVQAGSQAVTDTKSLSDMVLLAEFCKNFNKQNEEQKN